MVQFEQKNQGNHTFTLFSSSKTRRRALRRLLEPEFPPILFSTGDQDLGLRIVCFGTRGLFCSENEIWLSGNLNLGAVDIRQPRQIASALLSC